MGKKLSIVDKFFIDNHKDKLSTSQMAKYIGCHSRTVYNYLNKNIGARTEQEREISKGNVPPPAPDAAPPPEPPMPAQKPLPIVGSELISKRKHGDSHAVAMTKEASELGDEVSKIANKQYNPAYVYKMREEK